MNNKISPHAGDHRPNEHEVQRNELGAGDLLAFMRLTPSSTAFGLVDAPRSNAGLGASARRAFHPPLGLLLAELADEDAESEAVELRNRAPAALVTAGPRAETTLPMPVQVTASRD